MIFKNSKYQIRLKSKIFLIIFILFLNVSVYAEDSTYRKFQDDIIIDGKIIAAIGKSTSKLLEDIGIKVDICPESDFTSETLFKEI